MLYFSRQPRTYGPWLGIGNKPWYKQARALPGYEPVKRQKICYSYENEPLTRVLFWVRCAGVVPGLDSC